MPGTRFHRTILAFSLVLAGALAGCPHAQTGGAKPGESPVATNRAPLDLTVATYNVANFFDTYDNPYTADEGTRAKTPEQLTQLAGALHELNADVVVMEEIEAGGFLKKFVHERLADMNYDYVVDESTEDPRGISVAVLSRHPVLRIISHRLAPLDDTLTGAAATQPTNHFARDLLRVDLGLPGGRSLHVYGVHLKSKLTSGTDTNSNAWRLREAKRIVQIIQREMSAQHVLDFVFMGDCNDTIDSPPLQTILGTTTPPLTDTLAGVTPRITFKNARFQEGIDNILVSPHLTPAVRGPAEILTGPAFDTTSDHRPVRLKLHLR